MLAVHKGPLLILPLLRQVASESVELAEGLSLALDLCLELLLTLLKASSVVN